MITYSTKLGAFFGNAADDWTPYVKEPTTIKVEYDTGDVYVSDGTSWKPL